MTSVTDVLVVIDRLQEWIAVLAEPLTPVVRRSAVLPAVVLVVIAAPRIVVHRLLPWTGRNVVPPITAVLTAAVTTAGLVADVAFARLFRVLGLPLTGAHYAVGDWSVAAPRQLREAGGRWASRISRALSGFSSGWLLAASCVTVIVWNQSWCGRHPATGCTAPISVWWRDFLAVVPPFSLPW